MSRPHAPAIALITCSTREPGVNPLVSRYVEAIVAPLAGRGDAPAPTLHRLDLAQAKLPLYDEPAIPAPCDVGSAAVRHFDAFLFVTPQYNWSVPAGLKNALDYLFHEWTRKPAAIVSYGGHGGGKAAAHLAEILAGLRMRVVATRVALPMRRESMPEALEGGQLSEVDVERWRGEGAEERLADMVGELVKALEG